MNVWGRSWVYKLYVVGGIAGIAAYVVATGLSAQPGDEAPVKDAMAIVALWVVGLLALQGLQLWADKPADARATGGRLWSFARTGYLLVAALGVAAAVGGLLYVNGVDGAIGPLWEGGPSVPHVFTPVVVLVLAWGVRVPAMVRRAAELGDEHLRTLGLRVVAMPESAVLPTASGGLRHRLTGATVLGGRREGRDVTVTLAADGSVVRVACAVDPFERFADHVRITGGPDGIVVERDGGAGTQAWLADLLEAERLAGGAASPPPA